MGMANLDSQKANAQSSRRPFVILVNGYQDCCVWAPNNRGIYMDVVFSKLKGRNAEFRLVPWDSFRDGARQRSNTSNDAAFLREATEFINNRLDPNRPLILIGHSYGGDSILSLLPRINRNRRIQFVGIIDATAAGGFREPTTRRVIPSKVDYFFNRWQKNGLGSDNIVPFDSRLVNGKVRRCNARNCNQVEQNLARRSNGSEIRQACKSWEVTCPGYQPWPGGSNGTKAKRLEHNNMPSDAHLQRQMATQADQAIARSDPNLLRYAAICIGNKTSSKINFSYRWGNDSWNRSSVDPGKRKWFTWAYDLGRRNSPDFDIKFDHSFASGVQNKVYVLDRYAIRNQGCEGAREYYFKDSGSRSIDLLSERN